MGSMEVVNNQEELNKVTIDILDRIDNLKDKTKKSMVVGEKDIIKGIMIFEEVIKEINPNTINEDVISMIIGCVNIVLFKEEERQQHINSYIHMGINNCYIVLDNYNKYMNRKDDSLVKILV